MLAYNIRDLAGTSMSIACSTHRQTLVVSSAAWPQPPIWICIYGPPGNAEHDTFEQYKTDKK